MGDDDDNTDVSTGRMAGVKRESGKAMALWSNVSTEQGTGSTASPAVSGVGSTSGVTNPGTTLRTGSIVDLRARLGMMFPVYRSAPRKGKIIGGVTRTKIILNGSTALLQARPYFIIIIIIT